jgi:hypothetical protein
VLLHFVLALLIVADTAASSYRANYVCEPGDHIIRSEADVIEMAKARILQARYGSHGVWGYRDEKPDFVDFTHTENCCTATRTRTIEGLVLWTVLLRGETRGEIPPREVTAEMTMSNCGKVFWPDSYIEAGPFK